MLHPTTPHSQPGPASAPRLGWRRALFVQLLLIVVTTVLVHVSWAGCRQYGSGLLGMAPLGWALYGLVSIAGALGWLGLPFFGMPSAAAADPAWVSMWASGWGSALVGFAGWKLGFASPRRWIIGVGMLGVAVFCGVAYGFLCMAMSA